MTLVFLCVLIISLFLLADLITSFLVVFTVILTLVNIMGRNLYVSFWDLPFSVVRKCPVKFQNREGDGIL